MNNAKESRSLRSAGNVWRWRQTCRKSWEKWHQVFPGICSPIAYIEDIKCWIQWSCAIETELEKNLELWSKNVSSSMSTRSGCRKSAIVCLTAKHGHCEQLFVFLLISHSSQSTTKTLKIMQTGIICCQGNGLRKKAGMGANVTCDDDVIASVLVPVRKLAGKMIC